MSRLDDVDRAWLRERHVMLPLAGPDRYCTACARSWPCPTVQALDENDRLRTALPDPAKLWALADWIDAKYPDDSNPEVQTDLRAWARAIFAADPERWKGAWVPAVLTSAHTMLTPAEGEGSA